MSNDQKSTAEAGIATANGSMSETRPAGGDQEIASDHGFSEGALFCLDERLRIQLAGHISGLEDDECDAEARMPLTPNIHEALDVVEQLVREYIEDMKEYPDDILPKPSDAYKQLNDVAKKLIAAAYAIDNKDEILSDTEVASESFRNLNPIFRTILTLELPDELLDSRRAPKSTELIEAAEIAKECAIYFSEQGSFRMQKPLHRRDALMRVLVMIFVKNYREDKINHDHVGREVWAKEFLDHCEKFVSNILGEAKIPCPAGSACRVKHGEQHQGRLRRSIKDHLKALLRYPGAAALSLSSE